MVPWLASLAKANIAVCGGFDGWHLPAKGAWQTVFAASFISISRSLLFTQAIPLVVPSVRNRIQHVGLSMVAAKHAFVQTYTSGISRISIKLRERCLPGICVPYWIGFAMLVGAELNPDIAKIEKHGPSSIMRIDFAA
jgi:hypothetical protein